MLCDSIIGMRALAVVTLFSLGQAAAQPPQLSTEQSSRPPASTTPTSWVKDAQNATVLDTSGDESLALLWNGQDMLSVASLETGQLLTQLPSRGGNYMRSHVPTGQISSDKQSAWVLYADYSPVESAAEARRLMAELDAQEHPGLTLLTKFREEQRQRYRAVIAGTGGSFLTKWDLRRGESVAELNSPGRSILAFDQKPYQSRYLATLEALTGDRGERYWLCVYDASTNEKLAEVELRDVERIWNCERLPSIDMDESTHCVVVSLAQHVLQFRFPGDLALLSRTTLVERGAAFRVTAKTLQYPYLFAIREWPSEDPSQPEQWELVRHTIGKQPILQNARIQVPSGECSGPRLSASSDGQRAVVSASFEQDEQSLTKVYQWEPPGNVRVLAAPSLPHAVLDSGRLVAPDSISDANGQVLRGFSLPANHAASAQAMSDRVVHSKTNLLAASDSSLLEIFGSGIFVTHRGADATREILSADRFGFEKQAFPGSLLAQASAVYSAADQSYYVAIPSPSNISAQQAALLFEKLLASGRAAQRSRLVTDLEETLKADAAAKRVTWESYRKSFIDSEFFREVAGSVLGQTWTVFAIAEDGLGIRKVQAVEQAVLVRLAVAESCVGMLVVKEPDQGIQVVTNLDTGEPQTVVVPSATRDIAAALNATMSMSFTRNSVVRYAIALPQRIVFAGDGEQFFYANGSFLYNETRSAMTMQIDKNGRVSNKRRLSIKSNEVSELENMARFIPYSDWQGLLNSPILGMISQPVCISYAQARNRLYSIQVNNSRKVSLGAVRYTPTLAQAKDFNVTLSEYPLADAATPRHSEANWMFPEIDRALNSDTGGRDTQSDAFSRALLAKFPRGFEVDSSGNFCALSFGGQTSRTRVFDRTSRMSLLEIEGATRLQFLGDAVAVDGKTVTLRSLRTPGPLVFDATEAVPANSGGLTHTADGLGTCYFVGVGCTKFMDPQVPSLQFTATDVKAMAAAVAEDCRKRSWEFMPATLVDSPDTRQALGAVLLDLEQNATEQDRVVIAISSHGVRLNRGLYVISPETDLQSPQATAIGWPEFVASLSRIKSKRIYVFLDVCHAASFSEANIDILQSAKRRLAGIPGLVVIASSKPGEASFELDRLKHGVFTHALLECLAEQSLFEYAPQDLVAQLSTKTRKLTIGKQTPVLVLNNLNRKPQGGSSATESAFPEHLGDAEFPLEGTHRGMDALTILTSARGDGYGLFRELEAQHPQQLTSQQLLAFTIQQLSFGSHANVAKLAPFFAAEDSLPGLCERAIQQFTAGDKQLAIATAKTARDRFDTKIAWYVLDLLMSSLEGCTGEEYRQFTVAFKTRFPDFEYAWASFGNGLKAHSHEQSIEFLQDACQRFPESTRLLNYLGHSQASRGQFVHARATYDKAIQLDPEYGNLYSMRGRIAFQQADMARFEEDWILAAQLSATERHLAGRIQIYIRREMYDQANAEAETLFRQFANDASAAVLTYSAFRAGHKQRAREVFNSITDPQIRLHAENLLKALLAKSNPERTDRYLKALNQGFLFAVVAKELETCATGIPIGVTTNEVSIKSGKIELGKVGVGSFFRIKQEDGTWLLGDFWVNNQKRTGWIPKNSVRMVAYERAGEVPRTPSQ